MRFAALKTTTMNFATMRVLVAFSVLAAAAAAAAAKLEPARNNVNAGDSPAVSHVGLHRRAEGSPSGAAGCKKRSEVFSIKTSA